MGEALDDVNLRLRPDDAFPRNVHRMPDKIGTLVGVDSNMYVKKSHNLGVPTHLVEAWNKYIHEMYPIYDLGEVPAQTQDTDFSFHSIHNRDTNIIGFDHRLENPIVRSH